MPSAAASVFAAARLPVAGLAAALGPAGVVSVCSAGVGVDAPSFCCVLVSSASAIACLLFVAVLAALKATLFDGCRSAKKRGNAM